MRAILVILILILSVLQVQGVSAWSLKNHYDIAEKVYSEMPQDFRDKLSLDEMKNGADDPDTVFLDFKYHVYPYNLEKANFWLNQGKLSYDAGNYRHASYCYGVASHYISDGICGPHTSTESSRYLHTLYEIRSILLEPHMVAVDGDQSLEAERLWRAWVMDGDDSHILEALDLACSVSYQQIMGSIAS